MQKSIGGIEVQKLIFALNPPLRKTDVVRSPFYFTRFIENICLRSCPFLVPEISATKESEVIFV